MFMNEYDIDRAFNQFADGDSPVLAAAVKTLRNLRDATNRNSDGWCYWDKPSRASQKLQALIEEAQVAARQGKTVEDAYDRYRAAQTPLKSFRTRSGLDFRIVRVGSVA